MSHSVATSLLRRVGAYGRLMRLHRLSGLWLLMWPTLWGVWLAGEGRPDPWVFTVFVLGVLVMRSAGCAINDFADRDFDPHVARTRDRPLAAGEIHPAEAIVLFVVLLGVALMLVLTLNRLTQLLALFGALITLIYPFMKRYVDAPQLVLGLAFGWGVPMAFAAQTGTVPMLAWLVYLAVILWTVVYDTLYAMADRPDDLKIGVRSTAILFGEKDRAAIAAFQLATLAVLAAVGLWAGLGAWYAAGLIGAGGFALYQQWLIRHREPAECFAAFANNGYFGMAVFVGIALDYLFSMPV